MWPFKKSRIKSVVQSTKEEVDQSNKQAAVTRSILRELKKPGFGNLKSFDLARVLDEGVIWK